jgi:hypothetical protein
VAEVAGVRQRQAAMLRSSTGGLVAAVVTCWRWLEQGARILDTNGPVFCVCVQLCACARMRARECACECAWLSARSSGEGERLGLGVTRIRTATCTVMRASPAAQQASDVLDR